MFDLLLDKISSGRWQGVSIEMFMVRQMNLAWEISSGRRFGGNCCEALKVRGC